MNINSSYCGFTNR